MSIVTRREMIDSPTALRLIRALDAELSQRYPEADAQHFQLDPGEVAPGHGAFLVAYDGGAAVGCGAVRNIGGDTAEVKRMYVVPERRGQGIGRAVVAALEAAARGLGATRLVLETGVRQPDAIALYERAGFARIPPFGAYASSAASLSVCMGKPVG